MGKARTFAAFAAGACLLAALLSCACAPGSAHAAQPGGGAPIAAGGVSAQSGKLDAKFVIVGDSYSCANKKGIVPWPRTFAKKMGLTGSDYTLVRHKGYAFAKKGHRFISLLEQVPDDGSVTDVLIVGGAGNDYVSSRADAIRYYKKTIKLVRAKYPNARVWHSITSWRLNNTAYQKNIVKRLPLYRSLAKKCGVTYIKGFENTMKKHPRWYLPDKVHPNQKGHDAMAKFLAKKVRSMKKAA